MPSKNKVARTKQFTKSKSGKQSKSAKTQKNKKNKRVSNTNKNNNINSNINKTTLTSILDYKKNKSLTTFSKPSDIKSATSVGEFYNLLEIHDNINKNCINKVKLKVVDGIQLNKKVSKDICNCLFEKNKNLNIKTLEEKTQNKLHTPGSSCISILDKFIEAEKLKQNKIYSKSSKSSKSLHS
jgi:hypothetical protein